MISTVTAAPNAVAPVRTFWFTGLPGVGKSTLARGLAKYFESRGIAACVLDGDELCQGLCRDQGFSPDDREENMHWAAEIASLLNNQGLMIKVALISPVHAFRISAHTEVGAERFLEIHVDTPLSVCRQGDPKGLYARVEQDNRLALTGVSTPYEVPSHPALRIDTSGISAAQAVQRILQTIPWNLDMQPHQVT